jgi:3-phenylpropionate/trans-cinnamate dioxygenase ferredoxin reductase subunit
MTQQTIVVVGAGQAGAWAARTLRTEGFTGRIVLVGDEVHPPYERPPLSKEQLQPAAAPMGYLLSAADMAALEIEWRPSVACRQIDRLAHAIALTDGETMHYDKLVLATGGRPRMPHLLGIDAACVHKLRTLDDALRLRAALRHDARVLVIGGGWIGLEVAASARGLGCAVTLVEAGATLCARSGSPLLSETLAQLHRVHGVDLRMSAEVKALEDANATGCRAVFADGSSETFDLVVVGIGLVQNDELAHDCGLHCDRGVLVNRQCQTSDPDIYAAGDVTASRTDDSILRLESWQNVQDQGVAAARAILGQEVDYRPTPFFWSQQYDTLVQLAGVCTAGASQICRRDDPGKVISVGLDAEGKVLSAIVTNSARDFRTLRKFVTEGTKIDPVRFADPAVPIAKLVIS